MVTIDRVALADCETPEALLVEIFRQQPELRAPIPIVDIAHAVGITKIEDVADLQLPL